MCVAFYHICHHPKKVTQMQEISKTRKWTEWARCEESRLEPAGVCVEKHADRYEEAGPVGAV
eukprot:COSAG06_NODE_5902_length_3221_cov_14.117233_2_plen_62_part_00